MKRFYLHNLCILVDYFTFMISSDFFVYEQWDDGPALTGEKQFESSAELLPAKYSNCFDKPNAGPSRDTYR